jgi:hypothetical protein
MSRTRTVIWVYACDATMPDGRPGCLAGDLEVFSGQACNTGRGTVVHDQADADAVARQAGWKLGRVVLCPQHAGGGA